MNKTRLSIREKKTIKEGILVDKQARLSESSRYIEYAPGNGTLYKLLLIPTDALEIPGAPPQSYHVIWLTAGGSSSSRGFSIGKRGSGMHYSYIEEKLKVGISDAIVIGELLEYLFGLKNDSGAKNFMS